MPKRRHFNTTLYEDYFKWPFGKYCEHIIHTPRALKHLMPTKFRDLKQIQFEHAREGYLRVQGVRKNEWAAGSRGYMERKGAYIQEQYKLVLPYRANQLFNHQKSIGDWRTPPLYGHRNQWKSLEDTYF